jgi:uroporphyrin-3 C-methyltransferase/uroporphyrinogen III methyltransferase/synthase
MNELPSPSKINSQPDSSPQQAEHTASIPDKQRGKAHMIVGRLVYIVLAVLALALAAQWWTSRAELRNLRTEVAQRLQTGDSVNNESKILIKSVQEGMKELQAKVNVLESKQTEAQSQQLALEQLYQDLSKNRDDWTLAEIERASSCSSPATSEAH